MAEDTEGDSKKVEERIALVLARRAKDMMAPVPVAAIVLCRECKERCIITKATLQVIVGEGFKHYQVICPQCAEKQKDLTFKYKPFSPAQMQEKQMIEGFIQGIKGKGG